MAMSQTLPRMSALAGFQWAPPSWLQNRPPWPPAHTQRGLRGSTASDSMKGGREEEGSCPGVGLQVPAPLRETNTPPMLR
ncbi:MAG TPA: hypothetical protein VF173_12585 [Thermoanaerobaculia bacterium]|nr:hypothetical protein [Thermoanaerobaculia bacterium]